jgi:tetratricopeptide (TPR) repeat protein/tRNA A-37 threonylcarbamoyl transferase component Bud32
MTGGTRLGPYEIQVILGRGGMGDVYKAHDLRLQRDVAIKLLPSHLTHDDDARERLRREALAAAALDHPFICKIFEIGDHENTLFIVMEYIVGETLHARLAAGPLPLSEALRIAGEVAEALEAAHARRIVHRDLKPANVMLTTQGRVKVMDFGLAKQLVPAEESSSARLRATEVATVVQSPPLTSKGMRVGTPDYMSPEQVLGDLVDERSDVFSFGILLCELLTGRHPFRRSSSSETMTAILRDPPSISGRDAADLSGMSSAVLRRLLAKQRADRYGAISEVRRELSQLGAAPAGALVPSVESAPRAPERAMVGRDGEHAELVRGLEEAIAGRGSIVLVGGEPGIGKTRLTQELLVAARQRGCVGLVGHCYEGEGAPPYVPFIEMLEYGARTIPPATFRNALGDAASEVARLMPELRRIFSDIPPAIELPPEQQRRFLFNAYREFVDRSCRATPRVVVLEDLHWADEPTLLLLQHLAQTIETTPLLVVGTYRDVELDVTRPFVRTLEALVRQRLATRISLQRLPMSGVESMLRGMSHQSPPSSLTRVIFQETEGNPFFVEEVFQHLAEDGKLFDAGGSWRSDLRVETLQVPEGVRLVIGRRLQRLSDAARRVLTTAAVVGRTFSLSLVEALETAQPDAALDALEEAERAHLVVAESSAREPRYRFAHELIRQTLAEALSLPRRQRLHARVAEAIERVYAASLEKHASALAHHLYQAGTAADLEKTSTYLLLAAGQARAAAAHEESLAHLDNALSLREGESGSLVADIHARRAAALRSLGRIGEAVEAYERAIAQFNQAGDIEKMAASSVELGWVHSWNADMDAALRIARRALERLGEAIPVLRCRLVLLQAMSRSIGGDPDGAFAALAQARHLQQSLNDPDVDKEAAAVDSFVQFHSLQLEAAVSSCRDAVRRCRAARDPWSEVNIGFHEAYGALYSGHVAEAVKLFAEQGPLAERVGHQNIVVLLKLGPGQEAMLRGDFENAERLTRESLAFGRAVATGYGFLSSLCLGFVTFLQGRGAEAVAHLQDAIDTEPQSFFSGFSVSSLAWVLANEGDPAAGALLQDRLPRLPEPERLATLGAWVALVNVVESLALVGRRGEAAALHPSSEGLLATGVHWYAPQVTMFATAAGVAAACAREWTRAEAHHQRAVQQADAAYRICQPDARVWYADMLLARNDSGDGERARVLLAEALSLYESIGMPGFAQRASARLAGL